MNVDGVFSGHRLVDGGPALLLSTLLCRSQFWPGWGAGLWEKEHNILTHPLIGRQVRTMCAKRSTWRNKYIARSSWSMELC